MNIMALGWLTIALCFLMFELGHPGLFFFLSFFFGGISAAGISLLYDDLVVQIVTFFGGSLVAFYVLRWWVKHKQPAGHATNIYALQGKTAVVIHDITPSIPGQVKVGGEVWSARCQHGETIVAGTQVTITRTSGAYLIVEILTTP